MNDKAAEMMALDRMEDEAEIKRLAEEALRQLAPHSPGWVKLIRRYIRTLRQAAAPERSDARGASVMQRLLAAAGWDAGSLRHRQLEDALDGARLEIVDRRFALTPKEETAGREAVLGAEVG